MDTGSKIQLALLKFRNASYPLYKGVNTIGRNKAAVVNIGNLIISQNHAQIIIVDDAQHFITDLGSSNGTFLNGRKLVPLQLENLENNAEIIFGDVKIVYSKLPQSVTISNCSIHRESQSEDMTQSLYTNNTQLLFNETVSRNITNSQATIRAIPPPPKFSEDAGIHDVATQEVEYPQRKPCIYEEATQVVVLPEKLNVNRVTKETVEECDENTPPDLVLPDKERNVDDNTSETTSIGSQGLEQNLEQPVFHTRSEYHDSQQASTSKEVKSPSRNSELFVTSTSDICRNVVVEETLLEGSDRASNMSDDLLVCPPISPGSRENQQNSNSSDSDPVFVQKRKVRKLQSTQESTDCDIRSQVSGSRNEEASQDIRPVIKKKLELIASSDTDSDTDIECELGPKKSNLGSKFEDPDFIPGTQTGDQEVVHTSCQSTESQDIRPVIKRKKPAFSISSSSDSDTDEECQPEPKKTSLGNNLEDSDCIPATQDAFAIAFNYDNRKKKEKTNTQTSEESFKLGLTELMVDSQDENPDKMEMKESGKVSSECTNKSEVKDLDKVPSVGDDKIDSDIVVINSMDFLDDDVFAIPTQKLGEAPFKTPAKKYQFKKNAKQLDESVTTLLSTQVINNDIYLLSTQTLNEGATNTSHLHVESTQVVAMEDVYIQPTQMIDEEGRNREGISVEEKESLPTKKSLPTGSGNLEKKRWKGKVPNAVENDNDEEAQSVICDENLRDRKKKENISKEKESAGYDSPTQLIEAMHENEESECRSLQTKQNSNRNDNEEHLSTNRKNKSTDYDSPTQLIEAVHENGGSECRSVETQSRQDCSRNSSEETNMSRSRKNGATDYDSPTQLIAAHENRGSECRSVETQSKQDFNRKDDEEANMSRSRKNGGTDYDSPTQIMEGTGESEYTSTDIQSKKNDNEEENVNKSINESAKYDLATQVIETVCENNQSKFKNSGKKVDTNKENKDCTEGISSDQGAQTDQKADDKKKKVTRKYTRRSGVIKSQNDDEPLSNRSTRKRSERESAMNEIQRLEKMVEDDNKNLPESLSQIQAFVRNTVAEKQLIEPSEVSKKRTTRVRSKSSIYNTKQLDIHGDFAESESSKDVSETSRNTRKNMLKEIESTEITKNENVTVCNNNHEIIPKTDSNNRNRRTHKRNVSHGSENNENNLEATSRSKSTCKRVKSATENLDATSTGEYDSATEEITSKQERNDNSKLCSSVQTTNRKQTHKTSTASINLREEDHSKTTNQVENRLEGHIEKSLPDSETKEPTSKRRKGVPVQKSGTSQSSKDRCGSSTSEESSVIKSRSTRKKRGETMESDTPMKVSKMDDDLDDFCSPISIKKTQNKTTEETSPLSSPEKNRRKQKPKVVFTMLDSPKLVCLIKNLHGSIVETVAASTVLVTEHVKRSLKLLTAVGQAKPICGPEWITASNDARQFLDPWDYILIDEEAESKWEFSLRESLRRASRKKLFENYTFQIMATKAADVLKGAIEACGGKCVSRKPSSNVSNFVIVATPKQKNKYSSLKSQNPDLKVVEPEAIFDGVLTQNIRFEKFLI